MATLDLQEGTARLRREPSPRRGGLSLAWRVGVTVAALGLILWLLPTGQMVEAMRGVGKLRWLAVLGALLGLQVVAALKWRLLLAATGTRVRLGPLLRAHGAGLFANNFLPSLVGGDAVRAGMLTRHGAAGGALVVSVLADRVVDATALVLVAAVAVPWIPGGVEPGVWHLLSGATLTLVAALVAGPLLLGRLASLPVPLVQRLATRARTALLALAARPAHALAALAMALAIQASLVLANVYLGQLMGLALPLSAWFVVWPLAKLAALAPVSLGGLGVRQWAFGGLLVPFAVDPAVAVAESLVWESLLLALGLVAGGLSLWWRDRRAGRCAHLLR